MKDNVKSVARMFWCNKRIKSTDSGFWTTFFFILLVICTATMLVHRNNRNDFHKNRV